MVEYGAFFREQKRDRTEVKCFEAWTSFFGILNNLPKLEYSRYTEGFLLSIRNTTDIKLETIVSVAVSSRKLLTRIYSISSFLEEEQIAYLLNRASTLWPREKEIVDRIRILLEERPRVTSGKKIVSKWCDLDVQTYLLTGKKPSLYVENFSKKPISSRTLEKLISFPLVKARLSS